MGSFIRTQERDGILWAYLPRVVDRRSMPTEVAVFREIHKECLSGGCSAIMIDARDSEIRVDQDEKVLGVLALAKALVPGPRVAILARKQDVVSNGMLGRLAGLAGALMFIFSDEKRALRWLKRPDQRLQPDADGDDEGD